ncbi:hypothetical protein TRIUR3_27531 [Triticum urartu]|uniref:CCT domain-containing protein n=1 Tax=Triticum urartu TaxID=4572 RepID=M7ZW12_TRIUA|nr:hypothetical protein TRIUR3_27531 [Triticum urartu]
MASGGGGGRRRGSRRAKGKKKKKTKYLSLSRHLAKTVEVHRPAESLSVEDSLPPPSALPSPSAEEAVETPEEACGHEQQQLEPFALHPEAPSTLFAAAPSLTDILGVSSPSFSGGGEGGSPSCTPSPDASPGTAGGEEEDLARRALRGNCDDHHLILVLVGREHGRRLRAVAAAQAGLRRDPGRLGGPRVPLHRRHRGPRHAQAGARFCKPETPLVFSESEGRCALVNPDTGVCCARSPLLKLDYDEILAAWAGRGSLYIGGTAGHVTPKLELDSEVFVDVAPPPQAATWSSPEVSGRAERVRRYKEKRHARLFSKRIRYEERSFESLRNNHMGWAESPSGNREQLIGKRFFESLPNAHMGRAESSFGNREQLVEKRFFESLPNDHLGWAESPPRNREQLVEERFYESLPNERASSPTITWVG